ncbi:hypothetical protein D3C85_1807420 [compost metagenome]
MVAASCSAVTAMGLPPWPPSPPAPANRACAIIAAADSRPATRLMLSPIQISRLAGQERISITIRPQ